MIDPSPAARLLRTEAAALEPILRRTPPEAFDRPTVCAGWSVRDVLAHCSAALHRVASGDLHGFSPAENQVDVDARRDWPIERLLAELVAGYPLAAAAIDAAGGRLDRVALGEWVHGGDVRGPLGARDAYTSAGLDIALDLFVRYSGGLPSVQVRLPNRDLWIGPASNTPATPASLVTDVETLVRLLAGRAPDPARYRLTGTTAAQLILFT